MFLVDSFLLSLPLCLSLSLLCASRPEENTFIQLAKWSDWGYVRGGHAKHRNWSYTSGLYYKHIMISNDNR